MLCFTTNTTETKVLLCNRNPNLPTASFTRINSIWSNTSTLFWEQLLKDSLRKIDPFLFTTMGN